MERRDQDQDAQEQSEDYGYDLAHEVPAGDLGRGTDPVHQEHHHDPGHRAPVTVEPDGDYGYDEVHGL